MKGSWALVAVLVVVVVLLPTSDAAVSPDSYFVA